MYLRLKKKKKQKIYRKWECRIWELVRRNL